MKYIFSILALLFTLQINAQIPDSLEVDLPWQIVRVSSCDDTMGEGPKSDKYGVSIALESDIIEEDDLGNCTLRRKSWFIVDWVGGVTYPYVQLGKINLGEPLVCQEDIYLTYDQLPYTLTKDDLLINEDESHEYSFSYNDIGDVERVVNESGSPSNFELYLYDHTANTVCKTNIYKTQCEDDIVINVPETAEIVFDGEPYIELTLDLLGVEIDYPCDTYTTKIIIGSQSNGILASQLVGYSVSVKVEIKISNGDKYENYIDVDVTGIKPAPISMYIEDRSFVAGETIELDVWSEGIMGIAAWGLQLEFENAEVLALENGDLYNEIPINLYPDGKTLRALWYSITGLPIDIESDATWFTLTITPEIDGNTFDIFKSEQDPWNSITIEDENYIHDFDAEFIFNIAPRDVLDVADVEKSDQKVFPNPASNKISLSGLSKTGLPVKIHIYDLEGKLMLSESVQNDKIETTIDISDLPSGLFILKAQNGNVFATQKFSKI